VTRRLRGALLALALLAGAQGASTAPLPHAPVVVVMTDNAFAPAVVRIVPGTVVVWRNAGRNPHTVTADDGSWDSGDIAPGAEYRRRFDEGGAFRYFCIPHGFRRGRGMAGAVLVGEAGTLALPEAPPGPAGAFGRTLRVPARFATIQDAVDSARPGDLILIGPGVYREEVVITTPHLTLRGEDRNRVILDGAFSRPNGVKVLGADGVVVENMTARHYTVNGFFWTGVRGYRGSYLTAYSNGDYGLYAYDAVYGQFDHSYASGHPDSGFYIGQCKPCHALIIAVLAEHNALGYSGTNAGGELIIADSVWRYNRAGIVPNTLDSEALAPQDGTRIVGNLVYSNHNTQAPAERLSYPTFGSGIILAGGINNVVEGNAVWDHPNFGVLIIANLDRRLWIPSGHRVRGNTVWASGRADLALAAPAGGGTCFSGNRFARSRPPAIEQLFGCGSPLARIGGGDPGALVVMLRQYARAQSGAFTSADWRSQPVPPPQRSMPDPLAPPRRAWPTEEGLALPRTPTGPGRGAPGTPAEAGAFGPAPVGGPAGTSAALGLLLYLLPFLVYDATILAVAVGARRRGLRRRSRLGWTALAVLLPYLGALLYWWRRPGRGATG
jgi:plastocyanin